MLGGYTRTGGSVAIGNSGVAVCSGANATWLGENGGDAKLSATCITLAADGDALVAATTDGKWHAIAGLEVSASMDGAWPLALALSGDTVYAATGVGGVLKAPADMSAAPTAIAGATDARDIAVLPDGRLIVADGHFGTTVIDPATGSATTLAPPLEWAMTSSVTLIDDTTALVGIAGFGIVILDVSGDPKELGQLYTEGLTWSVAVGDGGLAMSADWTMARLYDISDVANPVVIGREEFGPSRATSVAWDGSGYQVAGNDHIMQLMAHPDAMNAELQMEERLGARKLKVETLAKFEGKGGAGLVIDNTGRAQLTITGFQTSSDTVTWSDTADVVIEAGETAFLDISVVGLESRVETISFSTNDPDYAEVTIEMQINPANAAVGEKAPDFITPIVAGHIIRLADYTESVVHLKLFNAY